MMKGKTGTPVKNFAKLRRINDMGESLTGLKRSCMCCDVNETMIGQEVTVMGWVQRRRDLGQLIFIALRDKTGLVQIAIDGNTA